MSDQKKDQTPGSGSPQGGQPKAPRKPLLKHPLKPGDTPSEDSGPGFGQSVEQGGVD